MNLKTYKETFVSNIDSGKSESNRRPIDLQSIALPTELCPATTSATYPLLHTLYTV